MCSSDLGECPIRGNRYNLVGHNYDLCESEFLKLTEPEKPLYVKIPPPVPPSVHTFTTSADSATTNGAAAGDGTGGGGKWKREPQSAQSKP